MTQRFALQTDELNGCDGKWVEIHKDAWTFIRRALHKVVVEVVPTNGDYIVDISWAHFSLIHFNVHRISSVGKSCETSETIKSSSSKAQTIQSSPTKTTIPPPNSLRSLQLQTNLRRLGSRFRASKPRPTFHPLRPFKPVKSIQAV